MDAGALFAGLGGAVFDVVKAVEDHNRYENDRNYQSELQQTIFDREDNAVQRRVADLEAAGLNKNLAAGSAAGAGSVVGRSTSPQMTGNPIGAALDAAAAATQIKNQQIESKILSNQRDISSQNNWLNNYSVSNQQLQLAMDRALLYKTAGIKDIGLSFDNADKKWKVIAKNQNGGFPATFSLENSPLFNEFNWQQMNMKNSADMLQKDADFYTADKIAEYLGIGASIFGGAGKGYRAFKGGRY